MNNGRWRHWWNCRKNSRPICQSFSCLTNIKANCNFVQSSIASFVRAEPRLLFMFGIMLFLKNLVYLNVFLVFLTCPPLRKLHLVTENNRVSNVGHVFKRFHGTDWFNCLQACHDEPSCVSYSYQRSENANGLCELNDCGFEDLCNRDKFLTYSKGFVFQQIKTIIKKVSNMIDKTKLVPCQVIKGI